MMMKIYNLGMDVAPTVKNNKISFVMAQAERNLNANLMFPVLMAYVSQIDSNLVTMAILFLGMDALLVVKFNSNGHAFKIQKDFQVVLKILSNLLMKMIIILSDQYVEISFNQVKIVMTVTKEVETVVVLDA